MATQNVFSIDGVNYNVAVTSIERNFEVLDTDNSGRVIAKGEMIRDVIGTFYNYTIKLETRNLDLADYDKLYEVISAPRRSHVITVPYGQTTKTFRAYITSGKDKMVRRDRRGNHWSGLSLKFVAMEANRT